MSAPSSSSLLDGVVYNFVKERNPAFLKDMYSTKKCKELEKEAHFFKEVTICDMLKAFRMQNRAEKPNEQQPASEPKKIIKKKTEESALSEELVPEVHESFPDLTSSEFVDVVTYKYLLDRKKPHALLTLYNYQKQAKLMNLVKKWPHVFSLDRILKKQKEEASGMPSGLRHAQKHLGVRKVGRK